MITLEICHRWPLNQSQTHLFQSRAALPLTREIYAICVWKFRFKNYCRHPVFLFAFCEYTEEMGKLGHSGI